MTVAVETGSAVAVSYAQALVEGTPPAGKWLRLAGQRFLADLEAAQERGLYFDTDAADRAVVFFSQFLQHTKGEWAGDPFELRPWQTFIVANVFGWKQVADHARRFRIVYVEVPRKNGKSTLSAGIGLYLFLADDEPGAEVYSAATKRDQARIVHGEAVRMVKRSAALAAKVGVYRDNLNVVARAAKYEPLGADGDTMDGLNVHGAIVDELHAHKTRLVWDVLQTATGARRQPLLWGITTAGYDRHTVCREQHDYGEQVLEGVVPDDSFFAFIAAADEDDDWRDPATWAKANPNLGVSVKLDYLEREARRADKVPAYENNFKRLHLNVWTEQATRWLKVEVWDAAARPINAEALRGAPCYGGLDLASTTDVAALALWFPPPDEDTPHRLLAAFWVPEENMRERADRDRVPYDAWIRDGWITATPGNVIDFDVIRRDVLELAGLYTLRELALDRWNSTQLQTQLDAEGLAVVPFGQGYRDMTAPTKQLLTLLLAGRLEHDGNPVLRWMASNVAVRQDPAGNLKPDRDKSREKIDGIVAAIMALGRAMVGGGDRPSIYESEGMKVL